MSGGEIAAIAAPASIAAIGVIWGIIRYMLDRRQSRKEEERESSGIHKSKVEEVFQALSFLYASGYWGTVDIMKPFLSESVYGRSEPVDLTKFLQRFEKEIPHKVFKTHWPEIYGQLEGIVNNIQTHNEDFESFKGRMQEFFSSKAPLPLRNFSVRVQEPSISEKAYLDIWTYYLLPRFREQEPNINFQYPSATKNKDGSFAAIAEDGTFIGTGLAEIWYGSCMEAAVANGSQWDKGVTFFDNIVNEMSEKFDEEAKAFLKKANELAQNFEDLKSKIEKEHETLAVHRFERRKDCPLCNEFFKK